METPALYLLPPIDPTPRTLNPVTVLLEALAHIARTPCTAARDADERRELTYHDAACHLASTFPAEHRRAIYARHAARLLTSGTPLEAATADELRVAALTGYGWACDRAANGLRNQGRDTWEAAAVAALQLYRNRLTKHLISRSATPAAVTA